MKIIKYIVLSGIIINPTHAFSDYLSSYLVTDNMFPKSDSQKEELGKLLMFDKILSGNKNISCATCHHPLTGLGDGLSLPIGEGGHGLGIGRNTGSGKDAITQRVPRNAPHIFNLGAHEFTTLFYDGRVAVNANEPSGFTSPAGDQLPSGLDGALAAQAMFPVTSDAEMAGNHGENAIANAAAENRLGGEGGVWDLLAERVRGIPKYVKLFTSAFDDVYRAEDISFVHIANAIAAYESDAGRCTNSPFDEYVTKFENLQNSDATVSLNQYRGALLFYGKANCSTCHSGPFQTDQQFHAIGVPQIGPGKGDNIAGYSDGRDDFGREEVTGNPADRYKFRTPSLRQVAQTGPWGHDGAFNTLEAMVRHHLNAVNSLHSYDQSQAVLPSRYDLDRLDFVVQNDSYRRNAIARAIEIAPISLSENEIAVLMDFLNGLTDTSCIDLRRLAPLTVPSGLPVAD